jgi:hypothetical protein
MRPLDHNAPFWLKSYTLEFAIYCLKCKENSDENRASRLILRLFQAGRNWCVMGEAKRGKDLIEKACMMAHSAPENFP